MTDAARRLLAEQRFHDQQAYERSLVMTEDQLRFRDDEYLDHAPWIRPAIDALQLRPGLRVLDFGCGHGMASVVMARRAAQVLACDLSSNYLGEARRRAELNAVEVRFFCCDGERLPLASECCDRVFCNAALHHLDVESAAREIHRVLTPEGFAIVAEPWDENRLVRWFRHWLPYPGKDRTSDEAPLRFRDLRVFQRIFRGVQSRGFQFTSMVRRIAPAWKSLGRMEAFDEWLFRRDPNWQRYARYLLITLSK